MFDGYDRRALEGAGMVVCTSLAIQLSAALASTQFDLLGPAGVSSLRFAAGAVILLAAVRPAIRGRERATWLAICGYGASLAVLNLSFYGAIDHIPLGVAVSLSFAAPLTMAVISSHRPRDLGFAALAVVGIVILGGVDSPGSSIGALLAVVAGGGWVGVALCGRQLGRHTRRVDGLALALPVSALVAAPFGAGAVAELDIRAAAVIIAIALGGLILPFALELEALRRLAPASVAVIYSVDPAIGAAIGLVALGQELSVLQVLGVAAVMAASVGVTSSAARTVEVTPV